MNETHINVQSQQFVAYRLPGNWNLCWRVENVESFCIRKGSQPFPLIISVRLEYSSAIVISHAQNMSRNANEKKEHKHLVTKSVKISVAPIRFRLYMAYFGVSYSMHFIHLPSWLRLVANVFFCTLRLIHHEKDTIYKTATSFCKEYPIHVIKYSITSHNGITAFSVEYVSKEFEFEFECAMVSAPCTVKMKNK